MLNMFKREKVVVRSTPSYYLGLSDAQHRKPCNSRQYGLWGRDREQYVAGYDAALAAKQDEIDAAQGERSDPRWA